MAGGRIKGITIELNGETVKLTNALKDVNKSLSTTQTALKDVDKLLKFNPGNADMLKQKQDLLSSAIDDTKKKLEEEKAALEQLQNAPNADETTAQQQALQREIAETESKLKSLTEESKNFGSVWAQQVSVAGEKVKGVGDKMQEVGTSLTTKVTAPIVAGAGAAVKAFTEVDEGLDVVTKKTGASGEALTAMQDSVKNLAKEIPTDFETAGAAVGEVNTRFGLVGQELEDLSGKFIKFAELNDTDVSTSIDQTQKAMAAFNVDTKDAGGFLDLLTVQAQRTGIDMNTLLTSLTSNAPALSEMGLQADGAAVFLADLEVSGIDSSAAMAGLKKALQNAAKEGKPMDQALKEVQDSMANAKTEEEGMQAAMELFGNKAGPAIYKACKDGQLSFDDLSSSTYDFSESLGAVNDTYENTLDGPDKMKIIMNELKVTFSEVGATLLDMLQPAMEKLSEVVKSLSDKWNGLSTGQQEMIIKIAGVVAAVGPLLVAGGKVVSLVGTVMTNAPKVVSAVKGVAGAAKSLWAVMAANPIAVVVTVIAGLVAGFIYLWNNCEGFREFWITLWEAIKTKCSEAVEALKGFIDGLKEKWATFKADLAAIWEGIKSTVSDAINAVKTTITTVLDTIKQTFTTVWEGIKTFITNTLNGIKTIFTTVWNAIKSAVDSVMRLLSTIIQREINGWKKVISTVKTIVTNYIINPFKNALSNVKTIFNNIKNTIETSINKAKDVVKNAVDKIKGFFNFNWSLPDLKLPHIVVGSYIDVPVLGTIPDPTSLRVDWYKKAYNSVIGFNKPTVIPTMSGYKGFGDGHGAEFVMGEQKLREIAGDTIDVTINVTAQPGQNLTELASLIETKMVQKVRREQRVFA